MSYNELERTQKSCECHGEFTKVTNGKVELIWGNKLGVFVDTEYELCLICGEKYYTMTEVDRLQSLAIEEALYQSRREVNNDEN